jgi:uncharacterized membrane protein
VARRAPQLTLGALVVVYVAVFGYLTVRQHARFATFGFDMGIHDQGIWLLSRFEEPFVTVRGLHYFGHHLNLITLLLVPAYWLGAGPTFLYLVETVALAAGAVPVYLLARDHLDGRPWLPLVPAGAYLLYPTVNWINWWHFHPEALAITPLLFAVWLGRRRQWRGFAVAVVIALSTKEDIALGVAMLGLVLAVAQRRAGGWRQGAVTAAAGAGWYVVATQVVMPAFNDGAPPFYVQEFFPQFGDDAASVLWTIATDPAQTWRLLTDGQRLSYYGRLLAPTGGLALLGLPFLLIAGPQFGANALSALATTYDARFHYSVVPTVAMFAATTAGLGLLARWHRWALTAGVVLLALSAGWTHRQWSPSPLGHPFDSGVWAGPSPRHDALAHALDLVPGDAGLATNYFLVPHATHRTHVYEWPNPWMPGNWGIANRDPDPTTNVDWLVLDLAVDQEARLRVQLTGGPAAEFVPVYDDGTVLVAKRRTAP